MFTVPFDLKRPLLKVFRSEFNTKALFKWSLKGDDNYNYHVLLVVIKDYESAFDAV